MQSTIENMTAELFKSIDKQDTETFLSFLSDDVTFRFANAPSVSGKAAAGEAVSGFFSSIQGVKHDLTRCWHEDDAIICHGTVTYTRHDSTTLCVPFANVLEIDKTLITGYLIFVDISDLYQ